MKRKVTILRWLNQDVSLRVVRVLLPFNAIPQDFWASIHLANIAAAAKAEADQAIQISRANAENKQTYQANTAQLIGTLKDRFICACLLREGRGRELVRGPCLC